MIVPKPDAFTQREKHQFWYGTASNLRLRRISRMRTVKNGDMVGLDTFPLKDGKIPEKDSDEE